MEKGKTKKEEIERGRRIWGSRVSIFFIQHKTYRVEKKGGEGETTFVKKKRGERKYGLQKLSSAMTKTLKRRSSVMRGSTKVKSGEELKLEEVTSLPKRRK